MHVFACINQKGGCAKTTTAVNLSACLASFGKKVLLIDLDPQGHASLALGIPSEKIPKGMASVLSQESSIEEILIKEPLPGLDLAPSNLHLAALEQQLSGVPGRQERLLSAFRRLQGSYDFILIDAPPSLGLLSFNALRVADEVLVPIDPSSFSLHGLSRLLETLDLLETRTGQAMKVWVLNSFYTRTRFAGEMLEMLNLCLAEPVSRRLGAQRCRTVIRNNVRLREAAHRGIPIIHYDPGANGAKDYAALAQEILEREVEATQSVWETAATSPTGPSVHLGGVLFTWMGSDEVAIAGDFNDWVPDRKVYSAQRHYEGGARSLKWLPSTPSRSVYRLRINGVWREDPFNPCTEACPFGGRNSVLEFHDSALASPSLLPPPALGSEWSVEQAGDPT